MPQVCAVYGHRLGRPKYFERFYVRHCQRCEYVATGEIVTGSSGISVQKGRVSNANTSGTRQPSVDSENPPGQIVESEHLTVDNADVNGNQDSSR